MGLGSVFYAPEFFRNEYAGLIENHLSKLESKKIKSPDFFGNSYKNVSKNSYFLLRKNQNRGCINNYSKISQGGLEIHARNLQKREEIQIRESSIRNSFKIKIKSKSWARRHGDRRYTNY